MGDVFLEPTAGSLPSNTVFEDGSIVCVHSRAPPSRSGARASRSPFTAVCVDAPGERILTSDATGSLVLYDLTRQAYRRVRAMGLAASAVAFNTAEASQAIAAFRDGSARVYDLDSGDVIAELSGHKGEIMTLGQTPDGALFLTASDDVAMLWSTVDWSRKRCLAYPHGIAGATIAAGAPLLALSFKNDTVIVWDVLTYAVVAKLRLPEAEAGATLGPLALADDGSLAVAGAANGCVYVWDLPTGALVRIVDAPAPARAVLSVGVLSAAAAAAQARALLAASSLPGSSASSSTASALAASGAYGPPPPSVLMLDDAGRLLQVELGARLCAAVLELEAPPQSVTAEAASIPSSTAPIFTGFSTSADARLIVAIVGDGRWVAYDVPQARLHRLEMLAAAAAIDDRLKSISAPRTSVGIDESALEAGSLDSTMNEGGALTSAQLPSKDVPLPPSASAVSATQHAPRSFAASGVQPFSLPPLGPPPEDRPRDPVSGTGSPKSVTLRSPRRAVPTPRAATSSATTTSTQTAQTPSRLNVPAPPPGPPPPRATPFSPIGSTAPGLVLERPTTIPAVLPLPHTLESSPPTFDVASAPLRVPAVPVAPLPAFNGVREGTEPGMDVTRAFRRGRSGSDARRRMPPPPAAAPLFEAIAAKLTIPRSEGGSGDAAAAITGTHRRLLAVLATRGVFPSRFRILAWRFLLRLPGNSETAALLRARGASPAWCDLATRFPVRDRRRLGALSRTVNALAHWSPVVGSLPFLPVLAFPFVKAFGTDEDGALETVLTVVLNWGRDWSEALPHPPLRVLGVGAALLAHWDAPLARALESAGADASRTIWPLLRSAFSEVLVRSDWEALWDFLFAHSDDPSLALLAAVALLRTHRSQLLLLVRVAGDSATPALGPSPLPGFSPAAAAGAGLGTLARPPAGGSLRTPGCATPRAAAEVAAFLRHHAPLNVRGFLRCIVDMRAHSPSPLLVAAGARDGGECSGPPDSLPSGFYPAFLRFPTYVVDAAAAERARIAAAENHLIERRSATANLVAEAAALRAETAALRATRETEVGEVTRAARSASVIAARYSEAESSEASARSSALADLARAAREGVAEEHARVNARAAALARLAAARNRALAGPDVIPPQTRVRHEDGDGALRDITGALETLRSAAREAAVAGVDVLDGAADVMDDTARDCLETIDMGMGLSPEVPSPGEDYSNASSSPSQASPPSVPRAPFPASDASLDSVPDAAAPFLASTTARTDALEKNIAALATATDAAVTAAASAGAAIVANELAEVEALRAAMRGGGPPRTEEESLTQDAELRSPSVRERVRALAARNVAVEKMAGSAGGVRRK